jgi:hypothetical protein
VDAHVALASANGLESGARVGEVARYVTGHQVAYPERHDAGREDDRRDQ